MGTDRGATFAVLLSAAVLVLPRLAQSADYVTLKRDGAKFDLTGRVVVEAQDGGVLLLDRAGKMWLVQPEEQLERSKDDTPYSAFDHKQVGAALLAELPDGFEIHTTSHYVVCYNTSKAYAQWTAALYERLYRAFFNFWKRRGFELHDPEMPMVAIVFADDQSYRRYARNEIGDAAESIAGYYNLLSNRVVMYDLSGAQALRKPGRRVRTSTEINRMLSRPEAGSLVATVIHEATHQIAFNTGLQTRLADIPHWVSEGIAMYFETPDLRSSKGWRGIGKVNRVRLQAFRKYGRDRPADSLTTLLSTNKRLQKADTALDAYAESWALTYYLIQSDGQKENFKAYLEMLAAKTPLVDDTPKQRIDEFEKHFGKLDQFDAGFLKHTARVR